MNSIGFDEIHKILRFFLIFFIVVALVNHSVRYSAFHSSSALVHNLNRFRRQVGSGLDSAARSCPSSIVGTCTVTVDGISFLLGLD